MRIPQSLIDQIVDRTDLVELIGARVQLKKAGKSYTACCPFHQEKSPSFHVNREKGFYHCFGCGANGNAISFLMNLDHRPFMDVIEDLAQRAHIQLPKNTQDAPQTTYKKQKIEQKTNPKTSSTHPLNAPPSAWVDAPTLDDTALQWTAVEHDEEYALLNAGIHPKQPILSDNTENNDTPPPLPLYSAEDLAWLEDKSHELENKNADEFLSSIKSNENNNIIEFNVHKNEQVSLYDLLKRIEQYYAMHLAKTASAQLYLNMRGISAQAIQKWQLGYAPADWQGLCNAFREDIEGLKQLGLVRENEQGRYYDLLRDRITFTIKDKKGRIVGFAGRALNNDIKPKYINSPESPVFKKNELLYGLYEAIQQKPSTYLMVEGYLDVISLDQQGIYGAVAAMGTASNETHLTMLYRYTSTIVLAFDGDAAGQKAAWRTLEHALPVLEDGRELRFLILPPEHDPDSLMRSEGKSALQKRIDQAPTLSHFIYDALVKKHHPVVTMEDKARVYKDAEVLLSKLPPRGAFKRLLDQLIKEKLGLFYKKAVPKTTDAVDYSFEDVSLINILILLLLYPELNDLHDYALKQSDYLSPVLSQAIQLIQQEAPHIKGNFKTRFFYLLGAWPDDEHKKKLYRLFHLQETEYEPIFTLDDDGKLKFYLEEHLKITIHQLTKRLKQSVSLEEKLSLRKLLNVLGEASYFRTLEQLNQPHWLNPEEMKTDD